VFPCSLGVFFGSFSGGLWCWEFFGLLNFSLEKATVVWLQVWPISVCFLSSLFQCEDPLIPVFFGLCYSGFVLGPEPVWL
jgi:hypothetical protein